MTGMDLIFGLVPSEFAEEPNVVPNPYDSGYEEVDGFPMGAIREAFNAVANPDDWKAPIRALVSDRFDPALIKAAVMFYTATEATVTPSGVPGIVRVLAEGYRAGPAGDH